jgi:hypothetical protein
MRLVLVLKALEVDEDQNEVVDEDQNEVVDEDRDVTGNRAVTEDQVVGTASGKRHSDIMDS